MDREKTIRKFEEFIYGRCPSDFKRVCRIDLMCSVLSLLKEQEKEINYLKKILLPESGHENDKDELPS